MKIQNSTPLKISFFQKYFITIFLSKRGRISTIKLPPSYKKTGQSPLKNGDITSVGEVICQQQLRFPKNWETTISKEDGDRRPPSILNGPLIFIHKIQICS